jgi:large subunit ribosomal protein L6
MSRIGKLPVVIPQGVQVTIKEGQIQVKGPKGTLSRKLPPKIAVKVEGGAVVCTRPNDERDVRALHGLARSLIHNMVTGVSTGYERVLDITGVGYKAELQGKNTILFSLGHTHPIEHVLPAGVSAEIDKNVKVILRGSDNEVLGLEAARIRSYRPVEPYKGKGVKYAEEIVRRKEGKAGAA